MEGYLLYLPTISVNKIVFKIQKTLFSIHLNYCVSYTFLLIRNTA